MPNFFEDSLAGTSGTSIVGRHPTSIAGDIANLNFTWPAASQGVALTLTGSHALGNGAVNTNTELVPAVPYHNDTFGVRTTAVTTPGNSDIAGMVMFNSGKAYTAYVFPNGTSNANFTLFNGGSTVSTNSTFSPATTGTTFDHVFTFTSPVSGAGTTTLRWQVSKNGGSLTDVLVNDGTTIVSNVLTDTSSASPILGLNIQSENSGGSGPSTWTFGALTVLTGVLTAGVATGGSTTTTTAAATATEAYGGPGAGTYTHQWYRSTSSGTLGSAVSGQTSLTLSDSGLTSSTGYFYTLQYTDSSGTVSSNQIALTTTSSGGGSPKYFQESFAGTSGTSIVGRHPTAIGTDVANAAFTWPSPLQGTALTLTGSHALGNGAVATNTEQLPAVPYHNDTFAVRTTATATPANTDIAGMLLSSSGKNYSAYIFPNSTSNAPFTFYSGSTQVSSNSSFSSAVSGTTFDHVFTFTSPTSGAGTSTIRWQVSKNGGGLTDVLVNNGTSIVSNVYTDTSAPGPFNGVSLQSENSGGSGVSVWTFGAATIQSGVLRAGTATAGVTTGTTATATATEAIGGPGTTYTHQWFRSTAFGTLGSAVSGQTLLNLSDSGLANGTSYYYTLQYTDASGTVASNQISLTTAGSGGGGGPVFSPGIATAGTTNTSSSISVSATAAANPSGSVTYQWYRSTSSGTLGSPISGAASLTLTDSTGLTAATAYYYTLRYSDASSAHVDSNQILTATAGTGAAMAVAQNLGATLVTGISSATVQVAQPTGGSGIYQYSFYISTAPGFSISGVPFQRGTNRTGTATGLTQNIDFWVKCVITDFATSLTSYQRLVRVNGFAPVRVGFISDSTGVASFNGSSNCAFPIVNAGLDATAICGIALRTRLGNRSVTIVNSGVSGSASINWVSGSANLNAALAAFTTAGMIAGDYVSVEMGVNDAQGQISSSSYATNMSSLLSTLTAAGYKVVLQYPTYREPGVFYEDPTNNGGLGFDDAYAAYWASYFTVMDSFANNVNIFGGDKFTARYSASNPLTHFNASVEHPGGIHPNSVGIIEQGNNYAQAILVARGEVITTIVTSATSGINGSAILGIL